MAPTPVTAGEGETAPPLRPANETAAEQSTCVLAFASEIGHRRARWRRGTHRCACFVGRQPEGLAIGASQRSAKREKTKHAALRACFPRASGPGPGPGGCARGK